MKVAVKNTKLASKNTILAKAKTHEKPPNPKRSPKQRKTQKFHQQPHTSNRVLFYDTV